MDSLQRSHLVEELQQRSEDIEGIPVLLDQDVWTVYEVGGGYDEDQDLHIVELTVPQQRRGGAPRNSSPEVVECHVEGAAYFMEVFRAEEPEVDDGYTIRLSVTDYKQEPYTFAEALKENVDQRETQYAPDGER